MYICSSILIELFGFAPKVSMASFKHFLKNLIFLINICTVLNIPMFCYADAIDLSDIEKALGINSQPECLEENCTIDIDSLLDDLKSEYIEQKKSASDNMQDIEKQSALESLEIADKAHLTVVNKITAKSQNVFFNLGEKKFFGNLSLEVHKCIKNIDPFEENDFILLSVLHNQMDDDSKLIFHGWINSFAPAISTLEHPIYEIIPKKCIINQSTAGV